MVRISGDHTINRWVVRASFVGLLAVLCFLTGFSVYTQRGVAARSVRSDDANRVSEIYQDARFWVGQEESLERKYRLEPGPDVLAMHGAARRSLAEDLRRLAHADHTPATRRTVAQLNRLSAEYGRGTTEMFSAVDARDPALVIRLDHAVVDPVFATIEGLVYRGADVARSRALANSSGLRHDEAAATKATIVAFALGLALLLGFALIIARFRRRLDGARVMEVERLAEIAMTDPLTGLRNHRAFHEDLARSLQRVSRSGLPVSLVMLDLDGLKQVNDNLGHQAGDQRLKALADVMRATERGSDCAYRIGGDEFAVILDGVRAWNALEFVQRLHFALDAVEGMSVSASAGVSEAVELIAKDLLIRRADFALLATKRDARRAAIYTPDMEPDPAGGDAGHQDRDTSTLANALALAVDSKDSYTRSHCQTVSQLCLVIAAELGFEFDEEHVARIRVGGLLHDVGKIGVPDAILNKPSKLDDAEYEQMRAHSVLGYDIVSAAGLPVQALWVRHHHERYDGRGYPDGLSGEDIPLESRIIFVADAFEAMTSDRPYRKAPGQEFAVGELRRHAGTQFDSAVVDALCRVLDRRPAVVPTEPHVSP